MEDKFEMAKMFISTLQNLNVCTFTQNNGEIYDSFSQTFFVPNQMFQSSIAIKKFLSDLKEKTIYHLTDHLHVSYCFVAAEGWVMMIGPYISDSIKKNDIKRISDESHFSEAIFNKLILYYRSVRLIEKSEVVLAAQTLLHCIYPIEGEANQIEIFLEGRLTDFDSRYTYKEISADYINKTHNTENKFMVKIMQGNAQESKRLIRIIADRFEASENEAGNNKSSAKNFAMTREGYAIARTLTRIAAKNTGVPSSALNAITDASRNTSMNANTIDELNRILFQTIDDVCTLVTQHRLLQYSPVVKRAIQYVLPNLSQPITAKDIARHAGVSTNYLSGIFKSETGTSLTEYVSNQRLESAANLLVYSSMPIQEICCFVGIFDSNYFAKLFKRKYRKSPSAYRRNPDTPKT